MKKLKDVLPDWFFEFHADFQKVESFLDVDVVETVNPEVEKFPNLKKNIKVWWKLSNGYAVGMRKKPVSGTNSCILSLPVVRMKKSVVKPSPELLKAINVLLPKNYSEN